MHYFLPFISHLCCSFVQNKWFWFTGLVCFVEKQGRNTHWFLKKKNHKSWCVVLWQNPAYTNLSSLFFFFCEKNKLLVVQFLNECVSCSWRGQRMLVLDVFCRLTLSCTNVVKTHVSRVGRGDSFLYLLYLLHWASAVCIGDLSSF